MVTSKDGKGERVKITKGEVGADEEDQQFWSMEAKQQTKGENKTDVCHRTPEDRDNNKGGGGKK